MHFEKISKKILKEFGIVFGIMFPIFIGGIIPIIRNESFKYWTLIIGVAFLIIGIYRPYFLIYPYKLWMFLGFILGWINSRIILGIIFILILMPIAFIMKLSGYDPLYKNKNIFKKSFKEIKKENNIDLRKIF